MECPPIVQNGECHVNFLRKQQCSFSWDWGPAFAPIGLNAHVNLNLIKSFDFIHSISVYPAMESDLDNWILDLDLNINSVQSIEKTSAIVIVKVPELSFERTETIDLVNATIYKKLKFSINKEYGIKFWWPNGHGEQYLYDMSIEMSLGRYDAKKYQSIGFRSVVLVQNPIQNSHQNGLTFFFEINNRACNNIK